MGKTSRKNREWSKEEKNRVLQRVLNGEDSRKKVLEEERISSSQYHRWLKAYEKNGIDGLANKRKPGNPLVKYQRKKQLTELELLEYENMKLRIENARLKKGYTNEEVMTIRRKK